jgi:N-acetylglucosamine-6-phosphate deacetylase
VGAARVRLGSTRIITPAGVRAGVVVVDGAQISDVVVHDARAAPDLAIGRNASGDLDLGDHWIAPGFIDTHVHGGAGAQCSTSDPDEILAVARFHARHGTTGLLATTVAAPIGKLESALRAIARARSETGLGAAVLGAHLEGPFLSRLFPGAMDPAHFVAPDRAAWQRLLAAAPGTPAMMTVAPELPGALELTRALVAAEVVVSLGHTDATYDQTVRAVEAGASSVTHLFNAMRPMHHRDPGVLGAALELPELNCELICDGLHVDGPALRIAHRAKGPGAIRLVTDATAAAGMPDGEYRLGAGRVVAANGRATVAGGSSLAGSTLTMADAVRNAVRLLGVPVHTAVSFATATPARLLGLADRKGRLAAGYDADLVVLGDDVSAVRTMLGGEWLP